MFAGSIVALVTPMHAEGGLDEAALEHLLNWHIAAGTDAIVLCGSTGEGATLNLSEKIHLVKRAIDIVKGKIPLIVAVGSNSTRDSIEQATQMSSLAIQGLLMICPYYNRPTQEGLYLHFEAIAKANVAPIILYNHPGRTGVDLQPQTVSRLAALKNIVGLKEAVTQSERFQSLRMHCPKDFVLLSGDDETCLEFVRAGGQGVISVAANIIPEKMAKMMQAALMGDHVIADTLHDSLLPLFRVLGLETNPIPLKYAMSVAGHIENYLRLPLTSVDKKYHEQISTALTQVGIL